MSDTDDRFKEISTRLFSLSSGPWRLDTFGVPEIQQNTAPPYFIVARMGDINFLLSEIDRLRQGLWDCAKYAGMDTDGNDTPRFVGGDLVKIAVDAVKEQRKDYDDLFDELPPVKEPANHRATHLSLPTVLPVRLLDELADETQNRMDQVVEAAVEWHQAGREGANWMEKADALSAAIDSLLELR